MGLERRGEDDFCPRARPNTIVGVYIGAGIREGEKDGERKRCEVVFGMGLAGVYGGG